MKLRGRATVRRRLAFALAGLLVSTGVVLLAASYVLVGTNLTNSLPPDQAPRQPPPGRVKLSGPAPETRPPSSVLVGMRGQTVRRVRSALLAQYALIVAALTLLAGVAAWFIAGRVLRPLREITAGAQRMTHERLSERLALTGPDDELRDLGETFNSMLARLQLAFENQQLFAASAAHELRTPFAVLRGELELALTGPDLSSDEHRALTSKLLRTVIACDRLTDRLLVLARGQVAPADRTPVRVDELVRDQLVAVGPELTVTVEAQPALVDADAALLGQLVENLIDNAVKHNVARGWIDVRVHDDGDRVELVVANSGRHLTAQQLPGLLEPFRRADRQRVGDSAGLGLSIVRAIVDAHDGQLELTAIDDGGLEVRVTLAAHAHALPDSVPPAHEAPVT